MFAAFSCTSFAPLDDPGDSTSSGGASFEAAGAPSDGGASQRGGRGSADGGRSGVVISARTDAGVPSPGGGDGGASGSAGSDAGGATDGGDGSDVSGRGGNGGAIGHGGNGGASGRGGSGASGRGGGGASGRGGAGAGGASGRAGDGSAPSSGGANSGGATAALFFSEYVEGSGSQKALEIAARGERALAGCSIRIYANGGSSASRVVELDGNVAPGMVSVVCTAELAAVIGDRCQIATTLPFNGDDAVVLVCGARVEDGIGRVGEDPGEQWGTGELRTRDMTLRRACDAANDVDPTDAFEPSAGWTAAGLDVVDGLGADECQATPAAG